MRRRNGFRKWYLVWFVFLGVMVLRVIQVLVQISPQSIGNTAAFSIDRAILEEWIWPLNTSTSATDTWSGGKAMASSNDSERYQVDITNNHNHSNNSTSSFITEKTQEDPQNKAAPSTLFTMHQQQEKSSQEHPKQEHEIVMDYNNSFSACLMVMDENHRLPEWLAYHYYMLPLRQVVLLVDPLSDSSPEDIVLRWHPYIKIDVWNFTNLVGYEQKAATEPNNRNKTSENRHVVAQQLFYPRCATYLKKQRQQQQQQQRNTLLQSCGLPFTMWTNTFIWIPMWYPMPKLAWHNQAVFNNF